MNDPLEASGLLQDAVTELFRTVSEQCSEAFPRVVIPVVRSYDPGKAYLSPAYDIEMTEMFGFTDSLRASWSAIEKGLVKPQHDTETIARLRILAYCHMIEADFPYLLLLNLCRVHDGLEPEAGFFRRGPNDEVEVCTKTGKVRTIDRIGEKIAHIGEYSLAQRLGIRQHFDKLWVGDLRNAFSHSQYGVTKEGTVHITSWKSGSKGETRAHEARHKTEFTLEEITVLSDAVSDYMDHLVKQYRHHAKALYDAEEVCLWHLSAHWDEKARRWLPGARPSQNEDSST